MKDISLEMNKSLHVTNLDVIFNLKLPFFASNLAGRLGGSWERWKDDTRLVIKCNVYCHFFLISDLNQVGCTS